MKIYIFGAGGHGKVVCDILQRTGNSVDAFVETSTNKAEHFGLPVISEKQLPSDKPFQIIIAIGVNNVRAEVAARLVSRYPKLKFINAVHPSATIARSARLGVGVVIAAGSIVGAASEIGDHCVLNTGSQVDHDCRLGDYVSAAPGVVLGGNVSVGPFSYIALGARVIHSIAIGEHSVIGAGATVTRPIGDRVVGYGTPCKVVRTRREDEKYL
jgi:sugar O-acyltransferase (sialic acid O-acetyltransferase NeuD family)